MPSPPAFAGGHAASLRATGRVASVGAGYGSGGDRCGSGRGGGDRGGEVERIDRRLADEEAEYLVDGISCQTQPVPVAVGRAVLLPRECLAAAGFLPHQRGNAAAEILHDVEQFVPEFALAQAGDDGEIEADIEDGEADGATAHPTLQVLQCGHEAFGIVPAGGSGWPWCAPGGGGGFGGGLPGFGGRCGGLWFRRAGGGFDEVEVAAGGG